MLRLFVALTIPEEVKERTAPMLSGLRDSRWVSPENLHITLRFIGEVDEATAQDIDAELADVRGRPIEIELSGADVFESRGRVRAVWTRVLGVEPLTQLQGRVENAVRRAGLDPDAHKYTPHVTLARLKNVPIHEVAPYLAYHGAFRAGPFTSDHFVLFRSHMGHGGSHYEPLVEYDLLG